jgi:propanol-preferring alcohol dehydrogenase
MGKQQPIQLNTDVPEPVPSPTQVIIDVKSAGLCHSDIMYMQMGDAVMPFLPMTQGHENAGVISVLGSEVEGFQVGDVVGVCSSGVQPPLGMFTPGGMADKLAADYRDLARVPEGLSYHLAALGTDAGMTSYHAMAKASGGIKPGMKVGVIGFGGLGQIGARVAVLAGAEVHVAEMKEDVWPLAESVGVKTCVKDAAEWTQSVNPLVGGDFDVVVDYAGFDTTQKALSAVKRGGVVVMVGLGLPTFTVSSNGILGKTIVGSLGGTPQDIEEVYALMLSGDIDPAYEEIAFEDVAKGLERLNANEVTGRLVTKVAE